MQLHEARASDVHHVMRDYRETTAGMERVVLISSSGLVLASSGPLGSGVGSSARPSAAAEAAHTERLAALASSLMSVARAATEAYQGGATSAVVINAERHHLLIVPVDSDTGLAVLAAANVDLGHISYVAALVARELASLVDEETRAYLCRMFLNPAGGT
ncbi:roadblock/LC7 domain-containing protein [Streptomyces noursei]